MKGTNVRNSVSTGLVVTALLGIVWEGVAAGHPAAGAQSKPAATEIKIDNFSFGPPELKIPIGATVTWANRDDIPHTVVSTDKVFKSKVLDTDEKFSFTFATAGTFSYFCSIHPKMTGKVIVQ